MVVEALGFESGQAGEFGLDVGDLGGDGGGFEAGFVVGGPADQVVVDGLRSVVAVDPCDGEGDLLDEQVESGQDMDAGVVVD